MLTHAPLPSLCDVARALIQKTSHPAILAKPWHRENEIAGWLSRSAWSLALVALWKQQTTPVPTIWLPDFFCNASLSPLRHLKIRLVFYPITETLRPDFQACRQLAQATPPDLFVLVHYFGEPSPAAPARDFCAHYGAWLIEDATHVLRPIPGVGEYGDFIFYSPHKLLPLPDGAVLVARAKGPGKLGDDGLKNLGDPNKWVDKLIHVAENAGLIKTKSTAASAIWLIKRLLQTRGIGIRPGHAAFTESTTQQAAAVIPLIHPQMSHLACRLLTRISTLLPEAVRWRQRYQLLWDQQLLALAESANLSVATRPTGRGWTPYLAAFQSKETTAAEASFITLQKNGLPVTTWPDLPPEVIAQRQEHPIAWSLRHSRIFLPLHQSLRPRDFTFQFTHAVPSTPFYEKDTGEKSHRDNTIELNWNIATREKWHQWMQAAERSNLLQSWAYGEAKAAAENWRVRRGVFMKHGEPIAIVQMLEKRVGGLLKVLRINRGPLFLSNTISEEDRYSMLAQLTALGSVWHGTVLSIAPELPLNGRMLSLASHLEIKFYKPYNWESIWLDLRCDAEQLRHRLNGKWRNMLVAAEKQALAIETGSTPEWFEWMVTHYQKDQQQKKFQGIGISTLRALWTQSYQDCPLIILRALHAGNPIGGICIACHGVAATYLVGWNSSQGRHLKANQFLLWQAILHLQQRGIRWFDLGGINADSVPGITEFKLGLGGESYELVGNGWIY